MSVNEYENTAEQFFSAFLDKTGQCSFQSILSSDCLLFLGGSITLGRSSNEVAKVLKLYRVVLGDGTFVKNPMPSHDESRLFYRIRYGKVDETSITTLLIELAFNSDSLIRTISIITDDDYDTGIPSYGENPYQRPHVVLRGSINVTDGTVEEVDGPLAPMASRYHDFDSFWLAASKHIVDQKEKDVFLSTFSSETMIRDFESGKGGETLTVSVRHTETGKNIYLQFRTELYKHPASDKLTGFLTVKEMTANIVEKELIQSCISHSYDFLSLIDTNDGSIRLHYTSNELLKPYFDHQTYQDAINVLYDGHIKGNTNSIKPELFNLEYIAQRLQMEQIVRYPVRIINTEGEIRNKELQFFPVDGNLSLICFTAIDTTEATKRQNDMLKILMHEVEEGGIINKRTGRFYCHTTKSVSAIQPAYSGNDFDSFVSERICRAIAENERSQLSENLKVTHISAMLEKDSGYEVTVNISAGGKERIKLFKFFWAEETKSYIGFVLIDITKHEREQNLQRESLTEALEMANNAARTKSFFLSSLSHDIRTPLNAIIGMTDLALEQVEKKEDVKGSLEIVKNASSHLLSLVSSLLETGMSEAGGYTKTATSFSPQSELSMLIRDMEITARQKGVTLHFESRNLDNVFVITDKARFMRIFSNLVGNAIKYTDNGGSVTLSATKERDSGGKGYFRFIVRDTGCGMRKEVREHVFEPYYRGRRKDDGESTGLGLTIVKSITEMLGGTVDVESREGEGTAFTLLIPLELSIEKVSEERINVSNADISLLQGKKVLLAEDNDINRKVSKRVLEAAGIEVVCATDGKEVLDIYLSSSPASFDFILMDVRMPNLDGLEATKRIRSSGRSDSSLPIIAMTASASESDIIASLKAGLDSHLSKPVAPRALYATLLGHLPGKA